MQRVFLRLAVILFAGLQLGPGPSRAGAVSVMIFCDGSMAKPTGLTTSTINGLRASGFNTMILFTMSVAANGDFTYNDGVPVCTNGVYSGAANWGALLAQCKTAPSSIKRIEMCIGGWGDQSWVNIKNLIAANGTGANTVLYRNLAALKNALGVDAIDNDDETAYDSASTIKFGQMCAAVGLKSTLCPYTNPSYWQAVKTGLGANCDRIYLQCYDGGKYNDPGQWNGYFGGTKVVPGYWDWERDTTFLTKMQSWSSVGAGGFLWPSCSGCNPPADAGEMLQYAGWILSTFNDLSVTPTVGFSGVTAYQSRILPASTVFTLGNSGDASLNWGLMNTSSWLSVSSSLGTINPAATGTTTISLNAAVATNLAAGTYAATVVFTNKTSGGTVTRNFSLNTAVVNWPVEMTGYNAALLASNTATAGSPGATAFDVPNNIAFYQQGLSGSTRGLPLTGGFSSACDSGTAFQFGPYGAADALMLGYTYAKAGTLTLATPETFNSLAVLAASANGGGQGTFVVNFADGSHSPAFAFNAQDWFYTVTNVAIQGFGRLGLGTSLSIQDNGDANPNMYQTTVNLAALGLTQPVTSITFSNPATAGASQNTAIFAVSGMPGDVPLFAPQGLRALPGTDATVQLAWNATAGATNYNIKQSLVSGGPYEPVGGSPGPSFTATGLANGAMYYFVVSAAGTFSESPNSSEASAMPGSYPGWLLNTQPVAYWPMNETAGPVAYDVVAGNNGQYAGGCTFYTGGATGAGFSNPHRAVFFNGSSGYVSVPRLIGDTNFTIVFWVKTTTTGGTPQWYSGKGLVDGEVGGTTNDFGVALVGAKVGFGVGNPDTTITSTKSINNGAWHQVAVTRNSGTGALQIYIDGALDASGTGPTGPRTSPPNLRLGCIQTGSGFLSGSMSDVACFNQLLNANQIGTLYGAASGSFANLSLANQWSGTNLILGWPANARLLEATNVSGPWTTNVSASPLTIQPDQPQKFYRVQK